MEYIKIGNYQINADTLRSLNKTDAKKHYSGIDPRIIEQAWNKANPKTRSRKRKKSE